MGKLAKVLGQVEKAVERKRLQAYHGTPHDVDKFSMDKIGTGEGAQAYGHGLYFAENPSVAKEYREKLASTRWIDEKGMTRQDMDKFTDPESRARKVVLSELENQQYNEGFKDFDSAQAVQESIETFKENIYRNNKALAANPNDEFTQNYLTEENEVANKAVEFLQNKNPEDFKVDVRGNLYKVELDIDPDTEMLDWDLPIESQSPKIQELYNQSKDAFSQRQELRSAVRDAKAEQMRTGSIPDEMQKRIDELQGYGDTTFFDAWRNSGNSGEDAYRYFEVELGGKNQATRKLNELGIKGIRYDDGFSRGKEGGTKNFVVFDDSLISIAERNGIPIERVDEVAQSQGVSRQQALASLIGGSTGIALMGGGERAEASMMNPEPQEPIQRQFEQERQASYEKQKQFFDNFSARRLARKAAKTAIGTGEAALTIGSGLANESAAGLAGLYGAATGQNPADIIQHFQENPSLYLPQTEEGMAQLEGLQGLIDDTVKYWGPRGGTQAIQNFKQSQDYLNTQGAKIDPSLGAGMATALGLLPEVL